MLDPRLRQLAHVMVDQSIKVQPLEKIWIRLTDPIGLPLATEVYKAVVEAGALPHLDIGVESLRSWFLRSANSQQINADPILYAFQAKHFTKSVVISANVNTNDMVNVDPKILQVRAKIMQPHQDIITAKPWILTEFPTPAMAQAAGMNLADLEEFYFQSTLLDWTKVEERMKKIAKVLKNAEIEVIGEKTHLRFSAKGRTWISNDWQANLPGGEVFTAPVDDSVEGEVYFNFPLTRHGVTMRDIHLWFEKGRVVKAEASANQKHLEHILDTDAGARRLGEFAFGANPGVTRYMDNVLFDEKIQGTIHMAVGFAFPECGGVNKSAVHMDMVKEMRLPKHEVKANGRIVLKDGQFVNI